MNETGLDTETWQIKPNYSGVTDPLGRWNWVGGWWTVTVKVSARSKVIEWKCEPNHEWNWTGYWNLTNKTELFRRNWSYGSVELGGRLMNGYSEGQRKKQSDGMEMWTEPWNWTRRLLIVKCYVSEEIGKTNSTVTVRPEGGRIWCGSSSMILPVVKLIRFLFYLSVWPVAVSPEELMIKNCRRAKNVGQNVPNCWLLRFVQIAEFCIHPLHIFAPFLM